MTFGLLHEKFYSQILNLISARSRTCVSLVGRGQQSQFRLVDSLKCIQIWSPILMTLKE